MIAGPSNPLRVDLKPYPAMKDSGHPWLAPIPAHWRIVPGVAAFREGQIRNTAMIESAVLSLSYGRIVVKPSEKLHGLVPKSFETYQIVDAGDVIIRPTDLQNDWNSIRVGLSDAPGIITSAYICLKQTGLLIPGYCHLLLLTYDLLKFFYGMGSGLRQSLNFGDFKRFPMFVPPLHEQAAIVRFLDDADRRIQRYIRAKQKLIKLLEEQKQAIIHRAVTRGLEPDARFKPSGVHWLGDIPSHWTVASLRFRYDQCLGKMVDAKSATGKHLVPYLRNVDVRWDSINTQDLPLIDIAPQERERFTLEVGDLLACEGRHLGRCAFWSGEIAVCGFQKALHRLRPLDSATDHPRFLFYCLYLAHTRDAFAASSTDKSIPHLTGEMLRAHRFPFPPVDEQAGICSYLDKTVTTVKRAIATIQAEVTLVHEYRTRLIADVVTGKLDVREAAARLPDEAAEPESVDDVDAVTDAEEGAADDLEAVPDGADA